jgi:hypothetical protein
MPKPIGFRPASHQVEILQNLPDKTQFIRQAIDYYLQRQTLGSLDDQIEILKSRLEEVLLRMKVSDEKLDKLIQTQNTFGAMTGYVPRNIKKEENQSQEEEPVTTTDEEAEEALLYFSDSISEFI